MGDPAPPYSAPPFPAVVRAPRCEPVCNVRQGQEGPTSNTTMSACSFSPQQHQVGNESEQSWIQTMRKKVNEARALNSDSSSQTCTIFRAPENIRRSDPKAYDPLVAFLGPYHHRDLSRRGSRQVMQDHKWRCVRHLLSRHGSRERASELLDRCLSKLKALDDKVRSCYSEKLYMDAQRLASIMLVDGCFIIHLLLKQVEKKAAEVEEVSKVEVVVVVEGERNEEKDQEGEGNIVELEVGDEEEEIDGPILGMSWMWNLVVYDLLKLENQIPFFIITTLFDILRTPREQGIYLPELALQLFSDIHPNKAETFTAKPSNEIHHLLHLFHSSLLPSSPQTLARTRACEPARPGWIPSAVDLRRAAVTFRRNEKAKSFLDVSFKNGTMEIPTLRVYDYTNSLLRNLIAFEQCYPDTMTYVTVYAAFMNCIVDSAEDVRMLDLKGILVNRLSTHAAVANLFNQLCDQAHYALDRNYLNDLFMEVNKYQESKCRRWRAGLIRDYFGNPWAIIFVVAAVVLLLLTFEQSFFAAFSYFRPS